ncbi:MAG: cyclic nucleotide-binding domain-containing protein [Deltaproteobacteria bacterium]|nr:cyclic nucleotide-binding domain-containing protein [Deltaproteobacteria bacterium]
MPEPTVSPFAAVQTAADLALLSQRSFFASVGIHDLPRLLDLLDLVTYPASSIVFEQGQPGDALFIVLEGHVQALRGAEEVARYGPGDHFGELAIAGDLPRTSTARSEGMVRLVRLSRMRFAQLAEHHPRTALHVLGAVTSSLGARLTKANDGVAPILQPRSLPRRATVHVTLDGRRVEIATGTTASALLTKRSEPGLLVAALLDKRPISLEKPIVTEGVVEPLTTTSWEGRRVYRRSVGLLFLEAAHEVAPGIVFTIGERLGSSQAIACSAPVTMEMAAAIERQMRALADARVPLREEIWGREEVRARLEEQGWHDAAALLPFYREEVVAVAVCGRTIALALGPVVPNASMLAGFSVLARSRGLDLDFGRALAAQARVDQQTTMMPASPLVAPSVPAATAGGRRDPLEMVHELGAWLRGMNVTSVGRFDDACVAGQVAEIIRVSEGFHEKHVGRIADAVSRGNDIRVVAIAGPSSSGKSTFIRRLRVQLEVNGKVPLHLSLDDYYVDRERTPRDETGEWDFESVDALDLSLLHDQVGRLLRGERLHTARFDFLTGKGDPRGGPLVSLGERGVLLVEGLHSLAPRVLEGIDAGRTFRVFIHPATALPFDRLSAVLPEDIRLLRRIVRDRHQRGYAAAESIGRWPSVRRGEEKHVLPWAEHADAVFDSSLVYEPAVLRVYAERYLLEVPTSHPAYVTAHRLRQLVDRYVPIQADHVPANSLLREFIGGSGFDAVG